MISATSVAFAEKDSVREIEVSSATRGIDQQRQDLEDVLTWFLNAPILTSSPPPEKPVLLGKTQARCVSRGMGPSS